MKLRSIEIDNYLCLGSVKTPLDNQGLVLVLGDNQDAGCAESNMAGKSSWFDAIPQGLYGINPRGIRSKDGIIRRGESDCRIAIQVNDDEIVREYSKSKNRLFLNGKEIFDQSLIDRRIGMDYQQFMNFAMIADDSTKKSAPLFASGTPKERFGILAPALNTGMWSAGWEEAKLKKAEMERQLESMTAEIATIDADTDYQNKMLDTLSEQAENVEKQLAFLKETMNSERIGMDDKKAEWENRIDHLKGCIDEEESKMGELKANYVKYTNRINQVLADQADINQKWTLARNKLTESQINFARQQKVLSEGFCPECEQPITTDHKFHSMLPKAKEEVEQLGLADQSLGEEYSSLSREKEDLEKKMETIEAKRLGHESKIVEYRTTIDRLQENIDNQEKEILKKENSNHEILDQCLKQLAVLIKSTEETMAKIDQNAEKSTKLEELKREHEKNMKYTTFWVKGFSNQGAPSIELRELIPTINLELDNYLPRILDKNYKLQIAGSRALRTGGMKNEISLEMDGVYEDGSRSERRRIDLATQIALSQLMGNCNCKWFDEVLSSLDDTGIDMVLKLFKEMVEESETLSSVFVISQRDMGHRFDSRLVFSRKDGVTYVE